MRTAGPSVPRPGSYPVTAVVPVKPLVRAKSRLALPADERRALALAFALDTIAALSGSPLVAGVLVVTSDPDVMSSLRNHPVRLAPDAGTGLDPAVRSGIRAATAWRTGTGVVVVPADLPCLRADDVTQVLAGAPSTEGAFVPDRATTGTTLVVYPPGRAAVAQYGPGSAARHRALGLRPLDDAPVRVRHDVDTLDDLHVAMTLGLGTRSAAVVAAACGQGAPGPSIVEWR